MRRDLVYRDEIMDSLVKEYNRKRTNDGLKLAWIEKAVNDVKPAPIDLPDNNVGELISRQSVIDMLDETKRIARRNIDGAVLMTFEIVLDSLVNITNALTTIQPKTGKWIDTGRGNEEWYAREYRCSECGGTMLGEANFCPDCGAKMEVNHESN